MSTATQTPLLRTRKLTKNFGRNNGIFGIDVSVSPGQVIGLIGPNGAGKSTTINAITGLLRPDSGTIRLFGKTTNYQTIYRLMSRIGVLYSEPTLDDDVTAKTMFKRNSRLLGKHCRDTYERLSRELDLDMNVPIGRLSLGNKKKVGIISALMHEPQLLIMDEPTNGLDPLVRTTLLRLIEEFTAVGGGVLLSSHDLSEVQRICQRIVMVKEGKIVIDGETEHLLAQTTRTFRLNQPPAHVVEALALRGISVIHEGGGELSLRAIDYKSVIRTLTDAGFYDFYVEHPSLADAFAKEYH